MMSTTSEKAKPMQMNDIIGKQISREAAKNAKSAKNAKNAKGTKAGRVHHQDTKAPRGTGRDKGADFMRKWLISRISECEKRKMELTSKVAKGAKGMESHVESARGLAHSKTLARNSDIPVVALQVVDFPHLRVEKTKIGTNSKVAKAGC